MPHQRVSGASTTRLALPTHSTPESAFRNADYYADCLPSEDCGANQTTQVLEHADETLVLYSYWERTPTCVSVPHIALDHIGDGALFETTHEGREHTWRIIHTDGGDIREFFDAIEAAVGDCAQIEVGRIMNLDHRTVVHKERYVSTDGVHINQAECMFSLVQPWLRKFHGLSKQGLEQAAHTFGIVRSLTLAGESVASTIDCLVIGSFHSST